MSDQPPTQQVPEWVATLVGQLVLENQAMSRALAAQQAPACPACGAHPGEWCDKGCAAHAAGTCGLPHPTG